MLRRSTLHANVPANRAFLVLSSPRQEALVGHGNGQAKSTIPVDGPEELPLAQSRLANDQMGGKGSLSPADGSLAAGDQAHQGIVASQDGLEVAADVLRVVLVSCQVGLVL